MRGRTGGTATVGAAAIVAALIAMLVAGCGGSQSSAPPPPPPPDQAVRDSFSKLEAAKTAHLELTADTDAGGQHLSVPGTGEVDLAQRGYSFSVTVPELGPLKAVGLGNVAYLQSDALTSQIPGGKPWILIDPARLQNAGPAGQQLAQAADNPFGELGLVTGAGPDTRVLGPDTVDNEPTTHYASTIDFARATQNNSDPAISGPVQRYAQRVGAPTVPSEEWVDNQGRLRRLVLNTPAGQDRPATKVMMTFSALGAPVSSIAAPPPDQVTDIAALLGGG